MEDRSPVTVAGTASDSHRSSLCRGGEPIGDPWQDRTVRHIHVIGIGAGADTDGQVLVFHDLLGLYDGGAAKFVKRYADLAGSITGATKTYVSEVRSAAFPAEEQTFHSKTMRVVRTRKDEKRADEASDIEAEISGLYGVPV